MRNERLKMKDKAGARDVRLMLDFNSFHLFRSLVSLRNMTIVNFSTKVFEPKTERSLLLLC